MDIVKSLFVFGKSQKEHNNLDCQYYLKYTSLFVEFQHAQNLVQIKNHFASLKNLTFWSGWFVIFQMLLFLIKYAQVHDIVGEEFSYRKGFFVERE